MSRKRPSRIALTLILMWGVGLGIDRSATAATDVNIVAVGPGSLDGFLSPTDGTLDPNDGGSVPGTLSKAALESVGSGVDLTIQAQNDITFEDFGTITLQTGLNHRALFLASGLVTFQNMDNHLKASGGSLQLNAQSDDTVFLGILESANGGVSVTANGDVCVRGIDSLVTSNISSNIGSISMCGTGTELKSSALQLFAESGMVLSINAEIVEFTNFTLGPVRFTSSSTSTVQLRGSNSGGSFTFTGAADSQLVIKAPGVSSTGITLTVDDLDIQNPLTATGFVNIAPVSSGRFVDLGTDVAGKLSLTNTELDRISAATLLIGSSRVDDIDISQPIVAHTGFNTLDLFSKKTIHGAAAPDVTVSNLIFTALEGATLQTAVSTVAYTVFGQNLSIENTGPLTIESPDGSSPSENLDGLTTLTATGSVTIDAPVTSRRKLTVTANGGPADVDITITGTGSATSTIEGVQFTAADSIHLDSGSLVKAANSTVALIAGSGDADSVGALDLHGDIEATNVTLSAVEDVCLAKLTVTEVATVKSTGGAILDCGDDGSELVNIIAGATSLSAKTGIGITEARAVGNAVETQVAKLEAQTATGGILLSNGASSPVALTVGGVDALQGVRVQTSGDIELLNQGPISVTNQGEIIQGPGAVTVRALGQNSDLQTGGQTNSANIQALNDDQLTAEAGRDLLIGDATGFGDVVALSGNMELIAGRDIVLNANGQAATVNGGALTATAGRDITMTTATGSGSQNPKFSGNGSAIALTTGSGGTFTAACTNGKAIESFGGEIQINADNIVLGASLEAGLGNILLRQAGTTSRDVDLGTNPSTGKLGISQSDLDKLVGFYARIGRTDNPGNLAVTAAITQSISVTAGLNLHAGGSITQSFPLQLVNLGLHAGGPVTLDDPNNIFAEMSASLTGAGKALQVQDANDLIVCMVDDLTGVTTLGDVQISSAGLTLVNGVGSQGGNVTLVANDAAGLFSNKASASVTAGKTLRIEAPNIELDTGTLSAAGSGRIELAPGIAGRLIDIGDSIDPASLNLSQNELSTVTATGVLQVGDSNAGDVNIGIEVSVDAAMTFTIKSGAAVGGTGSITAGALHVEGAAGVILTSINDVNTLSGGTTDANAPFFFNDDDDVTIDTVDGVAGLHTNGGLVRVVTGSTLGVSAPIAAGTGAVTLTNAEPLTIQAAGDISAGSLLQDGAESVTTTGDVTTAGSVHFKQDVTLSGGATINAGAGPVTFDKLLAVGGYTMSLTSSSITQLGTSTTLSGGTISGSGTLRLSSGDTLEGGGTISHPVLAESGSTLSPEGSNIGTLRIAGLDLKSGSTYLAQVNTSTPAEFDQILVESGTVSLGSSTLSVTRGASFSAGETIPIIQNVSGNAVQGTFIGLPENAVVFGAVPEMRITYHAFPSGNNVALFTAPNTPTPTFTPTATATSTPSPTPSATSTQTAPARVPGPTPWSGFSLMLTLATGLAMAMRRTRSRKSIA